MASGDTQQDSGASAHPRKRGPAPTFQQRRSQPLLYSPDGESATEELSNQSSMQQMYEPSLFAGAPLHPEPRDELEEDIVSVMSEDEDDGDAHQNRKLALDLDELDNVPNQRDSFEKEDAGFDFNARIGITINPAAEPAYMGMNSLGMGGMSAPYAPMNSMNNGVGQHNRHLSVELTGLSHHLSQTHMHTTPPHSPAAAFMMQHTPEMQYAAFQPPSPVHMYNTMMYAQPTHAPELSAPAESGQESLSVLLQSDLPMMQPGLHSGLSTDVESMSVADSSNMFMGASPSYRRQGGKPASPAKRTGETRPYKCRICGQPKAGHTCSAIKVMKDAGTQVGSTQSSATAWVVLTVKNQWKFT